MHLIFIIFKADRPRVKNYLRNSFVGFWNNFIPKLNRGSKDNGVPEEHNHLPNHFDRHSFYGVVRPYASYHNIPFPPPPMPPPTPFPKKPTSIIGGSFSTSL